MITRPDVQLRLGVLDPENPRAEVYAMLARISSKLDLFREPSYHQIETKHIEAHCTLPDLATNLALRGPDGDEGGDSGAEIAPAAAQRADRRAGAGDR